MGQQGPSKFEQKRRKDKKGGFIITKNSPSAFDQNETGRSAVD
jgi:hypothetical protein